MLNGMRQAGQHIPGGPLAVAKSRITSKCAAEYWRKGLFMRPFCQLVLRAVRGDSPPCTHDRHELAKSLTGYRTRSSLTQEALAAKLGVCRKTLQNWETGRRNPIKKFWPAIRSLESVPIPTGLPV